MSEPITISRKTPESKSLQYDFLREEGIQYIQKLAGKIWTDYNIHDPGVTILEVLCYAITELGYRAGYPVQDLLAADSSVPDDIRNFFTAREILPNSPVTVNDYRKLMIDVDVYDPENETCLHVGVKNAWIEEAPRNEIPVYVHQKESALHYDPDPLYVPKPDETEQPPLEIGILYDILLEFESCDAFGDLNENLLSRDLTIEEHLPDTNLNGLSIRIAVEFPPWDNDAIDWDDPLSVRSHVQNLKLTFINLPLGYAIGYELVNKVVRLNGSITTASDVVDIPGLLDIATQINDFVYYSSESMLIFYRQKVAKILEIIDEVKARLHANRNLCEDFYRLNALKVEKIAVCADIELGTETNVEEFQAKMFHEIAKFLSPTVHFYELNEMLEKCKIRHEYRILETNTEQRYFRIEGNPDEFLKSGDKISISGSRSNDGDYMVKSISFDESAGKTKISVNEEVPSALLTEGEQLYFYTTDEAKCLTADQIFEGPALEHGFIDNAELELADRRKVIHVSDLIQIIMDIPGVVSVRSIQIANIPLDNEDGSIISKSVKWCLQLAFEQNYVPRLSVADSKITYYKNQLPFRASASKVERRMDELENAEPVAKQFNQVFDFEVPKGKYREVDSYESIQNEFPLIYGIGEEGIATHASDMDARNRREAQALHLKGYLMIFDQLLANYFSQLAHVKDLFSMNAERDEIGNYIIDRTYYTQPLFDLVPNADALYIDKDGHEVTLNQIAEDEQLFLRRKNKFLDHLIGRFAESFTDYALLTMKLSGELVGQDELISDKLEFLNAYPQISSRRGTGFNYEDRCGIWSPENISGLRRRASFLVGIDEADSDDLFFSSNFEIVPVGDAWQIQVSDSVPTILLKSNELFEVEDDAKLALEHLIVQGLFRENYRIATEDEVNYYFALDCGAESSGISVKNDYPDDDPAGLAEQDIEKLIGIFENEYFNNPQSNRNNLVCPIPNYLEYDIQVDMVPDPPVATISYQLYSAPLSYDPADLVLSGEYPFEGSPKSQVDIISVDTVAKKIIIDGNIAAKLNGGDSLVVENSQDNDGAYTVQLAADVGGTTEIVVDEAIPSANVPLGELLYNNETEAEMEAKAEASRHAIFWQLIYRASRSGSYYFSSDSGAYRFRIGGSSGKDLAESEDADFNDILADEIANLPSVTIHVQNSTANNGIYAVAGATANGPDVEVTLGSALPTNQANGDLVIAESFAFSSDKSENTFIVSFDFIGILYAGDQIAVSGSDSVDGTYTIYSVAFDGSETQLVVEESVPADDNTGTMSYSKSFKINKVDGNTITIKGGYELKAVDLFVDFIRSVFFSHEGMHVLEHVLLRPKVKGLHFVDADEETLTEGLTDNGSLFFPKTLPIYSASSATKLFRVEGNISGELDASDSTIVSSEFTISETGGNDGKYNVKGLQYNGGTDRTQLKTAEEIPVDIPFSDSYGKLTYMKGTPIVSVSAASLLITINDPESVELKAGDLVEVRGSTDGVNDGRYLVDDLTDLGTHQELVISRVEAEVEDKLLAIVLDDDKCEACQIQDPYTCVASVILPHWQGRFDNKDFRRFFERQIRLEAPAHVFLSICWISCEQMEAFETNYKRWLLENARKVKDFGKLSAAQRQLVETLNTLRNIYPTGTLYDCTVDETLENAIILDNSVLGNA
ncbi:hypothetical protein [Mangrovibacterium diazotrophicum]|uniref:Baseplate J-like protein n=1 Tax=Mangrovibacterium diazotrophicum TaxID=1261403 RepID=A0A419VZ70_9BACT|nr:hypothetical protein [Mangrovibacterium diazotrophicum]RKD88360.1 hypothetical protein BC643_3509 [Mangrovibacterium diazotrophicum]